MKRLLSVILCLLLILSITPLALAEASPVQIMPPVPPDNPVVYTDVSEWHWAHWYIDGLAKEGITLLSVGNRFDPSSPMTRAGVVLGLAQVLGIEAMSYAETGFIDVSPTEVYAPYIRWARDHDIVGGTSPTTFDPEGSITRQDIATMFGRFIDKYGIVLPTVNSPRQFTDADSIASYAAPHVAKLQIAGIIGGYADGSFNPRAPVSRAEVAALLWRFSGRPNAPEPPPPPLPAPPLPGLVRPNVTSLNQKLTPLEINRYILSFLPTDPDVIKTYIKENSTIDFGAENIQAAAREISRSARTDYDKLRATYDFVIAHMTYVDLDGTASASEVLKNGYGDCTDYSRLTQALLYAQGIPAAIVSARINEAHVSANSLSLPEAFIQPTNHAFVVAFVNGYWRIVDPTGGDTSRNPEMHFDTSLENLTRAIRRITLDPSMPILRSSSTFATLGNYTLTIDGQRATDFMTLISDGQPYFDLNGFAVALSSHSKSLGKCFVTLPHGYSGRFISYIPGLKHETAWSKPELSLSPGNMPMRGDLFFGAGGVHKYYQAVFINSHTVAFPSFDAMRDICAVLDISISISGDNISIDTAKPYVAP